ncbi:MAG: adenylyl-sulfate kinase [Crocinitomicaceae bacterium]|nr:adenylyl-sulfate kinase [Crocinitomicaceae bacterium]
MEYNFQISKVDRNERNKHASRVILFTGLSGAGKSTLSNFLEKKLFERGINTYILDGDNIRNGINKELSFSSSDRAENIRRVAEISKLFIDAGVVVLACLISPYEKDRNEMRKIVGTDNFIEVYVNSPLEICEKRDTKGLYKQARQGVIKSFTGISDPYEEPTNPSIEIKTNDLSIDESVQILLDYILPKL